jgi:hypothetical protein
VFFDAIQVRREEHGVWVVDLLALRLERGQEPPLGTEQEQVIAELAHADTPPSGAPKQVHVPTHGTATLEVSRR